MKSSLFFINTDTKILDLMRSGDEEGLVMLYESNRRAIVSFVTRNNGSTDDAEDMLQESLIILWERVRSGRYEYAAKLSTFLYATVKNLWSRRLLRKRRESPGEIDPENQTDDSASALELLIASEEALQVHQALQKIGEQCKKLLLMFYWEELSMEEIAGAMGFANAETAKAKKYQCKKALEKMIRERS
ncbi:MAG: sigma-70 family RNA polymerase sigma factor [bacterium]